ncbi:response regulator transcription factor [Pluralibacter gergoviae]
MASLLLSPDINVLGNGFIFVDFSFHNLALFSNSDWITHLSRSTLRLVLVTDSRMEALATYWQRHCSAITTVLYSDNDRHVIASKIKKAISGLQTKETRRKKLTEYEVSVLQRLLRGEAVKDICYELEANRNSIYNVIRSLKNKLGGSLYHLQTH